MSEGGTDLEQQEAPRPVKSFTTAMGSKYTYDTEGRTTRFKTATGEQYPAQDLSVFVDLSQEAVMRILEAIHGLGFGEKVYVLERQKDDTAKIVRNRTSITDPEELYLGIVDDGKIKAKRKATLNPTVGYSVFDTRHYEEDGQWFTERHLGNKVAQIEYED